MIVPGAGFFGIFADFWERGKIPRSAPRVAEAARPSRGRIEGAGGDGLPGDALHPRQDELGDAVPAEDRRGLGPEVHQQDHEFAPVVGVDRAGGVQDGDAVPGGEAAAGPDLNLESVGDGEAQSGRDEGARPGGNDEGFLDRGEDVGPGGAVCPVVRKVESLGVREDFELDGRLGNRSAP